MRLRRKITVAFFLVSALVSLLLAVFLYRFVERQLRTELRSRLRNIATLGARTIDADAYGRLRAQVDELSGEQVRAIERQPRGDYQRLSDQLNAIRAAEPGLIRYVYVLVPTADPDHPRFVVDADVLAGAPDAPELSHFGQAYDVGDVPLLKQALADTRRWRRRSSTTRVQGALGVGLRAAAGPRDGRPLRRRHRHGHRRHRHARGAGPGGRWRSGVAGGDRAGAGGVVIMGTMLTRSVIALSQAVKRFAEKDFAVRTHVASKDEIGQLGRSFNAMAETIQSHSDNLEALVRDRTSELEAEKQTSDRLLLNVLPAPIETRLKQGEGVIVDRFEAVTVLFADIVGFTALSARTSPEALVAMLDELFTRFDALADRHGLEKIKTIGDAYMVVAGVPEKTDDHAVRMARMGLDMLATLADYATTNGVELTIRIGIHSGPVVAGVIGRNKFIYDLWGDTVNTASRMESHGLPSRVHVSEATVAALAGRFEVEARGGSR
jgi:class 3 adenylate cyclase